jgi:hypothetical protein
VNTGPLSLYALALAWGLTAAVAAGVVDRKLSERSSEVRPE